MQSSDFNNFFLKFPYLSKHFYGIFSINTLPKKIPMKKFIICNTEIYITLLKRGIIAKI
jgi:hypothetical protein